MTFLSCNRHFGGWKSCQKSSSSADALAPYTEKTRCQMSEVQRQKVWCVCTVDSDLLQARSWSKDPELARYKSLRPKRSNTVRAKKTGVWYQSSLQLLNMICDRQACGMWQTDVQWHQQANDALSRSPRWELPLNFGTCQDTTERCQNEVTTTSKWFWCKEITALWGLEMPTDRKQYEQQPLDTKSMIGHVIAEETT